ncbi:MAG: serine/threonine protein kinase [Planctomycetes bacterium]|nr:serine/threonine protein kinase [Planctomycetota bacterium]
MPSVSPQDTLPFPPPRIEPPSEEAAPVRMPEGFIGMSLIGRGNSGEVYKAHDLERKTDVAIKVVRLSRSAAAAQLTREAKAAGGLSHPNIVHVYECVDTPDARCCIMELVRGPDLAAAIATLRAANANELTGERLWSALGIDAGRVTPELRDAADNNGYFGLVAAWTAGLADAVATAHRHGVVHRDIKPRNILLSPHGALKLGDFGIAATLDVMGELPRATTPTYTAPERLVELALPAGAIPPDKRTDIWGLGLVLYELLALRPAYEGRTAAEALRALATVDPIPPSQANWAAPKALERVCLRALARNPDDRYQDAATMAAELREAMTPRRGTRGGTRVEGAA